MLLDQASLNEWYTIVQRMDTDKARELVLRKQLFGAAFSNPREGSNNKLPLDKGWILQGDYKINRKVDQDGVKALATGNTAPLVDTVFKQNYALVLPEYRKLGQDDLNLLADAVTETPGTPALKIVLPKR